MSLRVFSILSAMAACLLAAVSFSGCSTPGQRYASSDATLTPAQRDIFRTGRIPSGEDVAGLSKDQIKLAMGGDPTTFDRAEGGDVWIYVRKKPPVRELDASTRQPNSSIDRQRAFTDTQAFQEDSGVLERTSVFFSGDRATHARVSVGVE